MLAWVSTRRTLGPAFQALVQQWRYQVVCGPLVYGHNSLRQRTFATNDAIDGSNQEVLNVAVLGGGITGLASAYYLTQQLPNAQVTLFEGSSRLGGWLHSKQIDVGNGKVVFEQGPRTLRPSRPNGWVTLDLVSKTNTGLGLLLNTRVRYVT